MEFDNDQFYKICKQYPINVNKVTCTRFLKNYRIYSYKRLKDEYLHRISEKLNELSIVTASASSVKWLETHVTVGAFEHKEGTTHVGVGSMFSYIDDQISMIKKNIEKIEKVEDMPFIVGIKKDDGKFLAIRIPFDKENYVTSVDDNFLLPDINFKNGKKYKQSDDIMYLLSFWLQCGGEPRFSSTSQFSYFCSDFLGQYKTISPKTLESRFTMMGLPPKMSKLI